MAVTLKMIAEQADVSVMAVSAALNRTTSTRLSTETREKIQKIAAKMGYHPSLLAQALSNGNSRLIGVVVDSWRSSVINGILRGIEHTASQHGYRVMIAEQHDSPQSIAEQCDTFDQYKVEGILCLAHDYPTQRAGIQKVFSQRKNILFWEAPQGMEAPYVSLDASQAFRELLAGWKQAGRRHPALAIDAASGNRQLLARQQAFEKVARECGMQPELVAVKAWPYEEGVPGIMQKALREQILPRGIDAVLAESDLWAAALLRAAVQEQIEVPGQLAIVGWDNNLFCQILSPQLASIDLKFEELGSTMVEMFLERKEKGKTQARTVLAQFVNRASSGF